MSALDHGALASPRPRGSRPLAAAAGVALGAAVFALARHIAPDTLAMISLGVAGAAALGVLALAVTLAEQALPRLTLAVSSALALVAAAALVDPEARLRLFSLASAAFGVGLALWLARGARGPRVSPRLLALYAGTLAALSAYALLIVLLSHDLMIADFMTYRGIAVMVAQLADAGHWRLLLSASVQSITQDYSWAAALAPGLVLALTSPVSRAVYTFVLLALYAAPALLALAVLAHDLARRVPSSGVHPSLPGRRWPRAARPDERRLALGVAAVFVAYPAAMSVTARGMPDVGGLVLFVCGLRLADRMTRLLALPKGHDSRIAPMIRRVALALALTMFAMFAFRRWYAFAATGIVVMLAIETAAIALRRTRFGRRHCEARSAVAIQGVKGGGRGSWIATSPYRAPRDDGALSMQRAHGADFRWKDATQAAAIGLLTLLALMSPVIVDWLPNLGVHDYASTYAAYRKPLSVFLRELGDWVGLLPAAAAATAVVFLWARSRETRLLRLTLGSAAIAAALFLRIQTPYVHHLDLIAPALAAPVAAALMVMFARAPRFALAALAALGALTLTPLAAALNPLTPVAGLPRAPRTDLAELERMKDWVDARARPDAKVCGLGSSYTFSGELIDQLWQLHPERPRVKSGVLTPDVDTVDGPPTAALKDCAFVIVGDPVQTHLDPAEQQTVVLPSREMLTGQGIGAKFRRAGEVFHLEKGVSAVVFERLAPLDGADIAALQARWRAARAGE